MHATPPPTPTMPISRAVPGVRTITWKQPLYWLAAGWNDMLRCGWISVAHGLAIALGGAVIVGLAWDHFWFLAGAVSGFLVVAPVLATSLYALSRALERGERADAGVVLKTWFNWQDHHVNKFDNEYWCLVQFGALLALAATGWVITSAALITLLAPEPITSPYEFVKHVVLAKHGFLFELWLAAGGLLAAPIFASTATAIPLLLDRRATLMQAVLTSWETVLVNPLPMALWAAMILALTLLGVSYVLLGLIVTIPLLGHASWHAYRDLVDASALPPRELG